MKYIVVCVLIFTVQNSLMAHNNEFIPGDAYFSFTMYEKFVDSIKDEQVTVPYRRFRRGKRRCGYFGYWNLKIQQINGTIMDNLRAVHQKLFRKYRKSDMRRGYKASSFTVLVYNRYFDISNRLCLKYNEDSASLQKKYTNKVVYDGVRDPESIKENQRLAKRVAGLEMKITAPYKKESMGQAKPVVMNAKDLQFVILMDSDYEGYAKRKAGLKFYLVDEKITLYQYTKNGVRKTLQ